MDFFEKINNFDPPKAMVFELEKISKTPFQIFVVTFLSSRTKDETTIKVAKKFFKKYKSFDDILAAKYDDLVKDLYGVGFYRVKAKNLIKAAEIIKKNGFPKTLDDILKIPGIGKKIGKIILNRVYGLPLIGVDTHVHRILNRIGLVNTKTPEETDKILETMPYIRDFNKKLVALGQTICLPKKPKCDICYFKDICKFAKA